jgi:DDE superfamily endonuclease
MSLNAQFEEDKVQNALSFIEANPGITIAEACRQTRASYDRVRRRLRGVLPSNSRGGHNKKLIEPENNALKDYITMCYNLGKPCTIDNTIAAANSILRVGGQDTTVSRRWVKRWLSREHEFIKTMRSKPLSAERRASHIREDIEDHFKEYRRCRDKWGIFPEDTYNFDETGCQIGISAGTTVVVPKGATTAFVDDPGQRELVTATECCSATGYHVPVMLIFKGAYHLRKYVKNDLSGDTFFGRSESGFTNDKLTLAWLEHFNRYTEKRTIGRYRMLIFDGYGSHITQPFIEYCWEHRIRPFQLPPHSTHLLQPLDVGIFQTYKLNLKKSIQNEVFHGLTEMSKTDFFSIFQAFSDRTFAPKRIQSAFHKTGLVPYDPAIVLDKMKEYGGIQVEIEEEGSSSSDDLEPAFATLPPRPWTEFRTPITNTQRRRGSEYIQSRVRSGEPLTPIAIRVMEKVEKGTDQLVISGRLAQELLKANNAYAEQRKQRKDGSNKVVQKYGEIYGSQARRQIAEDEEDEKRVVNMREKRLQDPWKKRYKAIMTKFPSLYINLRNSGKFGHNRSLFELGLD